MFFREFPEKFFLKNSPTDRNLRLAFFPEKKNCLAFRLFKKLFRQVRFELHRFARVRMAKGESVSVQTKTPKSAPAVFFVADDCVSYVRQMNSQLIRPARYRLKFQQSFAIESPFHPKIRDRRLAVRFDVPESIFDETPDRCVNRSGVRFDDAFDESKIFFFD
jgi:hypothetical protein